MNEDIKAKWLAKLRDPETKQGRGYLKLADGSMCCLGVLCELAVEEGVDVKVEKPIADSAFTGRYSYDNAEGVLPHSVRVWAGMFDANPVINGPAGINTLAGLNDGGYTFAKIADVIEEQL
jgi:hypothetical protein